MVSFETLKIQRLFSKIIIKLIFVLCFLCPNLWAAQDAMVIADRAVIYSDRDMTSPVGYVVRGKKIRVGEVARNKAQVYPIMVSGKVAYIRVLDVTTEKESMDSDRLVAERFQKTTKDRYHTYYALSYYSFNSTISQDKQNGLIEDGDAFRWDGLSLKGAIIMFTDWEFQMLLNYMQGSMNKETYRAFEFGLGAGYRLINQKRFILRAEAQLLTAPYVRYEVQNRAELNSWGMTGGANINAHYLFNSHWGIEGFVGAYYMKVFKFDSNETNFTDFSPSFVGNRIGLGVNYTY